MPRLQVVRRAKQSLRSKRCVGRLRMSSISACMTCRLRQGFESAHVRPNSRVLSAICAALLQSETEEALVAHRARDVDAQMRDYSMRATNALTSKRIMAGECQELRQSIDDIKLHGKHEVAIGERTAEEMVACLRNTSGALEVELACARSELSERVRTKEDVRALRSELATACSRSTTAAEAVATAMPALVNEYLE